MVAIGGGRQPVRVCIPGYGPHEGCFRDISRTGRGRVSDQDFHRDPALIVGDGDLGMGKVSAGHRKRPAAPHGFGRYVARRRPCYKSPLLPNPQARLRDILPPYVESIGRPSALVAWNVTGTNLEELRVKESDRIAASADALSALGVAVRVTGDGMVVKGGAMAGGQVDSAGDHRIAMAFAAAGAAAPVRVRDCRNVMTSFPGFETLANSVGLDIEVVDAGR